MPVSSGLKGTHMHPTGLRKRKIRIVLVEEREIDAEKRSEAEKDM